MEKICSCGKKYFFPRDFWQHKDHAPKVVPRETVQRANGETPLDQPAIPVGDKTPGVDREERLPKISTKRVSGVCLVCEARRKKKAEKMARYRARLKAEAP